MDFSNPVLGPENVSDVNWCIEGEKGEVFRTFPKVLLT